MLKITRLIGRMLQILRDEPALPKGIRIGKGVFIDPSAVLDPCHGRHIILGDGVTIAPGVRIICHDASSKRRLGVTIVAPVRIEDRAFIGANAIILPGIVIGADSIVAAGSVVTSNVDPSTIVAGVPAKKIGSVSNLEIQRTEQMMTRRIFDENIYNRKRLPEEFEQELDAAIDNDGSYFLASTEAVLKYNEIKRGEGKE